MKEIRITSMNKLAFLLARGVFTAEDFTLEDNRLVLVAEVEEDYKKVAEEYREFEAENRDFLRAFKTLKEVRNSLLEKRQEIEE